MILKELEAVSKSNLLKEIKMRPFSTSQIAMNFKISQWMQVKGIFRWVEKRDLQVMHRLDNNQLIFHRVLKKTQGSFDSILNSKFNL